MNTATKTCVKCGAQMPADAKKCPNCKAWQDAKSLASKAIMGLVAIVVILLLASMVASRIHDAYYPPQDAGWKDQFERSR